MHVPDELRVRLLRIARRSLIATTSGQPLPPVDGRPDDPVAGAFVTLHVRDALRGCTGTLDAERPLAELVASLTVSSATTDPRFPPLTPEEVDDTCIEISVITPPLPGAVEDVVVGRHGVFVARGVRCGMLLPHVAVAHALGRDDFLDAACRKAGLRAGAWREQGTELALFEAVAFRESSGSPTGDDTASRPSVLRP